MPGHAGIPANELADCIAKQSLGGPTTPGLWEKAAAEQPADCRARPPNNDKVSLQFWQAVHDMPGLPSSPADQPSAEPVKITFASANVTTLVPKGPQPSPRRLGLNMAARKAGLAALGVQEARSHNHHVALSHYFVWASGATAQGRGGVELWLSKDHFDAKRVYIQHTDPRRLIAHVVLFGRPLAILVAHALPSDDGEEAVQAW